MNSTAALWLTVVGLGVYHGLNPSMGWPLAVANGLSAGRARGDRAVFATVLPLGTGHLLAMAVALLPFVLLAQWIEWQRELRIAAGALVLLYGVYKLLDRRHPRALARVKPTRLVWWSFLMATAHGAGLMLLPVTLGLCSPGTGPAALAPGAGALGVAALGVAATHTAAMVLTGLVMAWAVYRWLGLAFLRRGWFNLEALWALCLVLAGAAGIAWALAGR